MGGGGITILNILFCIHVDCSNGENDAILLLMPDLTAWDYRYQISDKE